MAVVKNYPLRLSIVLVLMMPLFILPAGLRQGQGKDMFNLAGSEVVIFLMCLACCPVVFFLLRSDELPYRWVGLVVSAFGCGCLSGAWFIPTPETVVVSKAKAEGKLW
jgi:hypothetical protein